jgi:endonuclease/exonuclease/phosphatase family metal-dependent hydrolase
MNHEIRLNSTSTGTALRSSGYRLVATLAALAAIFGQCDADEPIRILCYNIHYCQGTDGPYDIERLAKVINQSHPDLVALQEVDVGAKCSAGVQQARRLAKLTCGPYHSSLICNDCRGNQRII